MASYIFLPDERVLYIMENIAPAVMNGNPIYDAYKLNHSNQNQNLKRRRIHVTRYSARKISISEAVSEKKAKKIESRVTLIVALPSRLTLFWIISSQISSNFPKFPPISSNSPFPPSLSGTIKATLIEGLNNRSLPALYLFSSDIFIDC